MVKFVDDINLENYREHGVTGLKYNLFDLAHTDVLGLTYAPRHLFRWDHDTQHRMLSHVLLVYFWYSHDQFTIDF